MTNRELFLGFLALLLGGWIVIAHGWAYFHFSGLLIYRGFANAAIIKVFVASFVICCILVSFVVAAFMPWACNGLPWYENSGFNQQMNAFQK